MTETNVSIQESDLKVNEEAMRNIHNGLEGVVSGYLEHFIKKFDNFASQIRIADILLKAYEYRYDKIQGKLGNINDVLSNEYQLHSNFTKNCNRLAGIEQKMSTIEQKLMIINEKVNNMMKDSGLENKIKDNNNIELENSIND